MHCPRTNCSHFQYSAASSSSSAAMDATPMVACNHTTTCILPSWQCDGHNDCGDNEDERNCQDSECDFRFISALIVAPHQLIQCCTLSWHVHLLQCTCALFVSHTAVIPVSKCDTEPKTWQYCNATTTGGSGGGGGGECIPSAWFCDGDVDCYQGLDERDCSATCEDGGSMTPLQSQVMLFENRVFYCLLIISCFLCLYV